MLKLQFDNLNLELVNLWPKSHSKILKYKTVIEEITWSCSSEKFPQSNIPFEIITILIQTFLSLFTGEKSALKSGSEESSITKQIHYCFLYSRSLLKAFTKDIDMVEFGHRMF